MNQFVKLKKFTLFWVILLASWPYSNLFASEQIQVFVSVPPQAYIAETIGGNHVNVHVLVKSGQDPHTFEPTPQQIVSLSKTQLFLKVGIPFESQFLSKISSNNKKLKIIDTTLGINKNILHNHTNHPEEDPHIWLSPPLIKIQAENILKAYIDASPEYTKNFQKNYTQFTKEIDAAHEKIQKTLQPFKGQSFYVFHPAFSYFANTYGLNQRSIEFEGKIPTPKYLLQIIKQAKSENINIIFVQPQYDKNSAKTIAQAINGVIVEMDPLAKNILENLANMADKIKKQIQP